MELKGLIPLIILAVIHLFANKASVLGWVWHGRFLSFAGGISFAYVFVDLLPTLAEGQPLLKQTLDPYLPLLDRHAYVIALAGLLFYYSLKQSPFSSVTTNFWISIVGYQIFNLFVGASLADPSAPELQPLILFTIAMGMHYFVHDHNLRQEQPILYEKYGKWILAATLVAGYYIGRITKISDAMVAITIAFAAGGIMFNVMHYELPYPKKGSNLFFILGAGIYTYLILRIGNG